MRSDDQMMVDEDYESEGSTEEMLSGDEGDAEEPQSSSTTFNSLETFSCFNLHVPRYDSFSTSSSGIEIPSYNSLNKTQSCLTSMPVFKEPFQTTKQSKKQQEIEEDNGLTPPIPQSPPSDSGFLNTSPYRTPPKRTLSASCSNFYNTAEAERLRTNLSERFKTGDGNSLTKRDKFRPNRDFSNENAPPNLLTRSQPILPIAMTNANRNLVRAQTAPHFAPYPQPVLPIISNSDECQRISSETLVLTLQKNFPINFIILDCRYDFEYEGGHISNAIHCPPARCEEILRERFIDNPIREKIAIIFHCEFSSKRGPSAYFLLRKLDRAMNDYPQLTYPDMYVLDGGYREFFHAYPQYCFPNGYIEMKDKSFKRQLQICESQRKKGKPSKIYRFASGNSHSINLRHSSNSINI